MAEPSRVGRPALRSARVTRFRRHLRTSRAPGSRIGRTLTRGLVRPGRAAVAKLPDPVTGALSIGARARLMLALAGVLLVAVDVFTVSLALPDISAGIGIGPGDLHRSAPVLTAFLVAFATTLLLAGRLAELWGVRRVMLLALGIYAAGSLCAATAESLAPFLTGRVLQGLAGGALVPISLTMVDAWWPRGLRSYPRRLVGAAQDAAIVAGPLLGALVLALANWRALFWLDFLMAGLIAWALIANDDPRERRRRLRLDRTGATLTWVAGGAAALVLLTPDVWVDSTVLGWAYEPTLGGTVFTSPMAIAVVLVAVAVVVREFRVPGEVRPVLGLRRVGRLTSRVDLPGAGLFGLALGLAVAAMAGAAPERGLAAGATPYLLAAAVAAGATARWWARRAPHPLIPRSLLRPAAARAALLVSALSWAALVAVLVYVPLFGVAAGGGSSRTDAAFVLLRMLILVPIGTVAGGWLLVALSPRVVAPAGLFVAGIGLGAMALWDGVLRGAGGTVALGAVGLGLGLTIRPVAAALHATLDQPGVTSVMTPIMTARVVGMALGLGALTAAGLSSFYASMGSVLTPDELCPSAPAQCVEYELAVRSSTLGQIQTVLGGAAVLVAVGAVVSLVMFRSRRAGAEAISA